MMLLTTVSARIRQVVRPAVGERGWAFLRSRLGKARRIRRDLAQRRAAAHETAAAASEKAASARALAAMSGDLTRLATHFGTDKWGAHRYAQHYQRHFDHLRNRPVRLLEIGIGGYSRAGQGGASLRMWKHFFPHGSIVGLDLHDKSFVEEERIRAYRGDQTDPELLRRIVAQSGPFDLIIDDGSHRPEHVVATFGVLFPLLADDGIYAIEDTQTSYWPEYGGSADLADPGTSMAFFKRMADGLNFEEFVDDDHQPGYTDTHVVALHFYHNLVFVQKGRNAEGTLKKQILKQRYAHRQEG